MEDGSVKSIQSAVANLRVGYCFDDLTIKVDDIHYQVLDPLS